MATEARHQVAVRLVAIALMAPILIGGDLSVGPNSQRLKAGPGGTGGIPKTVGPTTPTPPYTTSTPVKIATAGQVIDAVTRKPIANCAIVITNSLGDIVGLALTDLDGVFVVYLYDEPGLELAIPEEGVAGLSIEAGDIVTIFVP